MTPLVLLHGFTGSPQSWDAVQASLEAPAIRPTLLGHEPVVAGHESSVADHDRVQTFGDEVERLAAFLPAETPVHLAGYSLGARLALWLALARPERVARLTLVSGHPGLHAELERQDRRAADARWCALLENEGIVPFVDAWEAQPLFATQSRLPAAVRAERRAERLRHDPKGLARSLRTTGLAEMPDATPRLASLRVPVSVVVGELDAKFLALGRATVERLPQGRLVVAPNAGHDLLLEQPNLVALVLREETPKP